MSEYYRYCPFFCFPEGPPSETQNSATAPVPAPTMAPMAYPGYPAAPAAYPGNPMAPLGGYPMAPPGYPMAPPGQYPMAPPPTMGGPVASHSTHIPPDVEPYLGGLTTLQADTIMSLVSIAENSTTSWWNNYAYVEDIGDGRGMTVSLVGFCSGTGDLLWVFRDLAKIAPCHALVKYIPTLTKVDGSDKTTGLECLARDIAAHEDEVWRRAVWDGILEFYINPTMKFAAKVGAQSAISKGFLFDTALNHGSEVLTKFARRVKAAKCPREGGDETVWLHKFMDIREKNIVHEDRSTNNGQPDRVIMWRSVLKTGNTALNRPINNLVCYGDTFNIV